MPGMYNLKPGDIVECIQTTPSGVTAGERYTVASVELSWNRIDFLVRIEEFFNRGWFERRFKPVSQIKQPRYKEREYAYARAS